MLREEPYAWMGLFGLYPDWGFRYLSESDKNGFEMHFECYFSPLRIQTLTWSRPYMWFVMVTNIRGFCICAESQMMDVAHNSVQVKIRVLCLPPGLRHRLRCWRSPGYWGNRVCGHSHTAGVHSTRVHQESGRQLRWKALPGPVGRGRGLLLGRGGGWKTGSWKQEVSIDW